MQDKDYLIRCIELAKLGGKLVRPNPQVGAVIVHENRIIGEGYHKAFGDSHAEVNAINSVAQEDRQYLPKSTIYVSLEPCCHFGNTPPCTDLIIKNKIPKVRIFEVDPTQKVNGKGIEQLRQNGIEVKIIPLSTSSPSEIFKINQLKKRPFVQLKFAKSRDNFIGQKGAQVWLSNDKSNIFTHKLRAYTDAILVGTNTAIIDNPTLNLRNYPGKSPKRVVLDREGKIPKSHTLLSDSDPCIIFTETPRKHLIKVKQQIVIDFSSESFIDDLLKKLFEMQIYHLMVEGGAALIKSFVKTQNWDEAVIINTSIELLTGIKAINLNGVLVKDYQLGEDKVHVIRSSTRG